MRLTLDHNCLIDLEENRPSAPALRELIELHRAARIQVFVGSISASENLPGKVAPDSYAQFKERLDRLGINELPHLLPVSRVGLSFVLDACVWADETVALADQIKAIVHPNVEPRFADYLTAQGLPADADLTPKWRNLLCDIEGMAAHIRAGHDMIVIFLAREGVRL